MQSRRLHVPTRRNACFLQNQVNSRFAVHRFVFWMVSGVILANYPDRPTLLSRHINGQAAIVAAKGGMIAAQP